MSKNRSTRLEITDMPRDKGRALGSLRQVLAASFNYCRQYPDKMRVFGEVVAYVNERVEEWQEANGKGNAEPFGRPKPTVSKVTLNKDYVAPKAPHEPKKVPSNSGNSKDNRSDELGPIGNPGAKGTNGPDGVAGIQDPNTNTNGNATVKTSEKADSKPSDPVTDKTPLTNKDSK